MSSTETLVVAHLGPSAGGFWFSTHKLLLYPTSLAGPVSIGASSPAVEYTLGGVPAPVVAICFVSVFRFRLALFPSLKLGVLVLYLLKPSLLHTLWPLSEGVLVVIVTARTSPSLRVVYDVHDCFVDRHKKDPASSNGQAWRLNKWP